MIVGILWIAMIYIALIDTVYEGTKLINKEDDE